VQINVGHLNAEGIFTGSTTTLALAGNVRAWGAADTAVDLLWKVRGRRDDIYREKFLEDWNWRSA